MTENVYFSRPDVQSVIHAPHINWTQCSIDPVFVNGVDDSLPSTLSVLPRVIEKSKRTIVSHGTSDAVSVVEHAPAQRSGQVSMTSFCYPLALAWPSSEYEVT
jgi:Serine carboxypeptidase